MLVHTDGLREKVQAFAFDVLFREELGWDTYKQTLSVVVGETVYALGGRAQKRGFVVLECAPGPDGAVPENATRVRIQHQVAKLAHEHIIIYTDTAKTQQVWQWVKREPGRPAVRRELRYHRGQSGEQLVQRLRAIEFGLEEEDRLNIVEVGGRVRAAFDVERITKRFYDRFKSEHDAFRSFIRG